MSTNLRMPGEPDELPLPAVLLRNAEDHGELPALSWDAGDGPGSRHTLTWAEVRPRASASVGTRPRRPGSTGWCGRRVCPRRCRPTWSGSGPDGQPYLVALLVLDAELAPVRLARHGIEGTLGGPAGHLAVQKEVERAVEAANARLNHSEQVKRLLLLSEEWSPESGELPPSLAL